MPTKRVMLILLAVLLSAVPFVSAQDSCSSEGTNEEFETTFVNDTNTDIIIHWLDYSCVEAEGSPMAAGESFTFTTYDGHEFIFRDGNGKALLQFMVNTIVADDEVLIGRSIAEGAAAAVMFETLNPGREALGLAPVYFDRSLYDVLVVAAAGAEGDYSAFGSAIADLGLANDIGWAGNSQGPNSTGELMSVEEVIEILTVDVEDSLSRNDGFGWANPDVRSFASYADESVFGDVFSTQASVTPLPESITNPATEAVVISTEGSFEGGESTYTFEAEEGVIYGIYLVSNEFDTVARLYDAAGNEIASDDDSGGELNSLLIMEAPSTGTYTVGVDSYNDQAIGAYELSITNTSIVILNSLTAQSSTRNHALPVEEGVLYFVAVESDAFDTTVAVNDAAGTQIASNDDSFGTTNSLATFTATSTGEYTIVVTSYNGTQTGSYAVLIGAFAE